jgi:hypothetical protein
LPWLSALFICLLLLFIWGVYNKFHYAFSYASSPQVESTPIKITTEPQISSQSEEPSIFVPEITDRQNNSQPQLLAYDFPLNSCGDKDPGGTNSWYPVYVENTEINLNLIKSNYCRDAILKYREEKEIQSIQVASFLDQIKAQEFADLMQAEIGSGEVGESLVYDFGNHESTVTSDEDYSLISQRPLPTQFVEDYYQNLNNGNYQTAWNQLSTGFQQQGGGYSEYVTWWDSVREIRIGQIELIEQDSNEALVYAELMYVTNTGTNYEDTKTRIYLTWDFQSNTWLFEKKI